MRPLGLLGSLLAIFISGEALALCGTGFRVTVVQNSDIRLAPGVADYLQVRFITTNLPIPAAAPLIDCGVYARSEVPGLSVVSAYGVFPQATNPPGVWTPIGIAGEVNLAAQPWFGTDGHRHILFTMLADGTTPAGTQGQVTLAVNQGGEFAQVMRTIGTVNVVASSSNAATWFSVTSTAQNVSGHRLILDHPLLNNNAKAKLFVAHLHNPQGLTPAYWNHPIATHYDGARWAINNSDGAVMPTGLGFNVRIEPSATQYYTGNPALRPPVSFVKIDDPIANGNPYATILVGPTSGLAVNPHPIAVHYVAPSWRIVNADRTRIPAGVRFNVKAFGFSAYHQATLTPLDDRIDRFVSNSAGVSIGSSAAADSRPLWFWWQLDRRSLPMIVTRTLSPMGKTVPPEPKYTGLKYIAGLKPQWAIVNEDQSAVPASAAFNVAAPPQPIVQ